MATKKKQFTLDWYKELGWTENPFVQKNLEPIEKFITGHEEAREKLNFFVIQHQPFGTIAAEKGCGATTMALWLSGELSQYRSRTDAVYIPLTGVGTIDFIHAIITSTLNVGEKAIVNSYYRMGAGRLQRAIADKIKWKWLGNNSFYECIATKRYTSLDGIRGFLAGKLKDKPLVVILDHIEHMHKQHAQILQSFFFAHLPIQVVAVGTKEGLAKSPLRLLSKKDSLRIHLQKPTYLEMKEMLKKRIDSVGGAGMSPLKDVELKKIYEKNEKNPRAVLSACQEYCVKEGLVRMRERQLAEQKAAAEAKHPGSGGNLKGSKPEAIVHPFTEEKISEHSIVAPMDVEHVEPAKPSFEIPSDILKQIEEEELISKKEAKKEGKKDSDDSFSPREIRRDGEADSDYKIKIKDSDGPEEISVVESLDEARAVKKKAKKKKD